MADRINIPLDRIIASIDVGREIAIGATRLAEWDVEIDSGGHNDYSMAWRRLAKDEH